MSPFSSTGAASNITKILNFLFKFEGYDTLGMNEPNSDVQLVSFNFALYSIASL